MKLGLYGINFGACVDPEVAIAAARAAEDAGFDSVWTAEHVVLPEPRTAESPIPAGTPLLDPATALAHVAGHTSTLRLATGIIILPQRNPIVLAKELASVDVLSRGRLIFGLGAGYIPAEFAAIGAVFEERGARTDEAIEVMRTLWSDPSPRFEGRFWRFANVDAQPRPVQKPHPPFVVGGMSAPALRRAVRQGDGWYGFALDLETTRACIEGLRRAEAEGLRPDGRGALEISVTPAGRLDRDSLRRYEDLGVQRLIPIATGGGRDEVVDCVESMASALQGSG
jgi:probable F420-dependent oxidoreductase